MAVWASRSPGYKVGMLGIILFSLLYLIGFASPFWILEDGGVVESSLGLWLLCVSSRTTDTCVSLTFKTLEPWFHISRFFETAGLLLLLATCLAGIINNCRSIAPEHDRRLEVMGIVGGILGFIGAMVFVGKYEDALADNLYKDRVKMAWAFYLATVGSAGAVVVSILLAISNKPWHLPPAQDPSMHAVVISQHQAGGLQTVHGGGVQSAAYPYGPSAPVYHVPPPHAGYPTSYAKSSF